MPKSLSPDLRTQNAKVIFISQKCSIWIIASQSKCYLYIILIRTLYLPSLSIAVAARFDFYTKAYLMLESQMSNSNDEYRF
jgi:hypothetical protein